MYIIDTNILFYHFNGNIPKKAEPKLNDIFQNNFNISIITKMEFLGFKKHTHESFNKAKSFLDYAIILYLTDTIVDKVIEIKRNNLINFGNAVIAAAALIHNFTLVTKNTENFNDFNISIYNPFQE